MWLQTQVREDLLYGRLLQDRRNDLQLATAIRAVLPARAAWRWAPQRTAACRLKPLMSAHNPDAQPVTLPMYERASHMTLGAAVA